MSRDQLLIEWNDKILEFLLNYRKQHPGFKFWLRSRESTRSNDQGRLAKGIWFQGSDYIFISFHGGSGGTNMTRSIGWVVEFDDDGIPHYHIEIVWPGETNQNLLSTYKEVINRLGGFKKINEVKYVKDLPDKELFGALTDYIEQTLPVINDCIASQKAAPLMTIPDEKFERQLERVLYTRDKLKSDTRSFSPQKTILINNPLNTILYGPPGTGKTYNTVNKALEIIGEDIEGKSRKEIKDLFELKVTKDQILFITFHQSMSYEDFIEGIKPLKPQNNQTLGYDIVSGIFKKACAIAAYNSYKQYTKLRPQQTVYSFDDLYDAFVEKVKQQLNTPENPVYKTLRNREVEVKEINSNDSIIACAKGSNASHVAPLTRENMQKLYDKYKSIDEIRDLQQVRDAVQVSPRTTEFFAIFRGLKEFEKNYTPDELTMAEIKEVDALTMDEILIKFNAGVFNEAVKKFGEEASPVVLIIDEINRGNISQIFGELITLIEEDKRLGKEEAIEVILPYSKEKFGIPPNLYIVGTMNTADRSVEALDTALRRRFVFEHVIPNEELLSPQNQIIRLYARYPEAEWNDSSFRKDADQLYALIGIDKSFEKDIRLNDKPDFADDDKIRKLSSELFTGVNLQTLLSVVNKRLQSLLTKDHTIGHAWLMNVYSLENLQMAFKNKILPLLQEFFYNDYAKIGLVLGKNFVTAETIGHNMFAAFDEGNELASDYADKIIFTLNDPYKLGLEDFKFIYLRHGQ